MFSGSATDCPSGTWKTMLTLAALMESPAPGNFSSRVEIASIAGVPEMANSVVKGRDSVNAAVSTPARISSHEVRTVHLRRKDHRPSRKRICATVLAYSLRL